MYKKFLNICWVILFGAILFLGCAAENEKSEVAATNLKTVKIDVQGMTCSGCEFGVETALKKDAGVTSAEADFTTNSAEVAFDHKTCSAEQLVQAVKQSGYQPN